MNLQVDNLKPVHPYRLQRNDIVRMSTVNSSRTYRFLHHSIKTGYRGGQNFKIFGQLTDKVINRLNQKERGTFLLVVQVFENVETKTKQTRHTETHVFKQYKSIKTK